MATGPTRQSQLGDRTLSGRVRGGVPCRDRWRQTALHHSRSGEPLRVDVGNNGHGARIYGKDGGRDRGWARDFPASPPRGCGDHNREFSWRGSGGVAWTGDARNPENLWQVPRDPGLVCRCLFLRMVRRGSDHRGDDGGTVLHAVRGLAWCCQRGRYEGHPRGVDRRRGASAALATPISSRNSLCERKLLVLLGILSVLETLDLGMERGSLLDLSIKETRQVGPATSPLIAVGIAQREDVASPTRDAESRMAESPLEQGGEGGMCAESISGGPDGTGESKKA